MSSAATAVQRFGKLGGVFFRQFGKGKDLVVRHPLDTNVNKYYETIERIVIPQCMNVASDVPGYPERIKELLTYTNLTLGDSWNFSVELAYRMVADKAHQTEENITKMYLLRAMMDLMFTMGVILDDWSDKANFRMGKMSWYKICEGGAGAAIYDGAQVGWFPILLLQNHFKNDPGYLSMVELVSMSNVKMFIGQTLDMIGHDNKTPSLAVFNRTNYYKFGQYLGAGSGLGLLHAGISSEDIIEKTLEIFMKIGMLRQVWDDFVDYYCTPLETGKPSEDIVYGRTTWVSARAMEAFTPSQAKRFKESYGSSDPAMIEKVHALYDEIDMPKLYVDHMIDNYNTCKALSDKLPDQRVRNACISYLEWLIGRDSHVEIF